MQLFFSLYIYTQICLIDEHVIAQLYIRCNRGKNPITGNYINTHPRESLSDMKRRKIPISDKGPGTAHKLAENNWLSQYLKKMFQVWKMSSVLISHSNHCICKTAKDMGSLFFLPEWWNIKYLSVLYSVRSYQNSVTFVQPVLFSFGSIPLFLPLLFCYSSLLLSIPPTFYCHLIISLISLLTLLCSRITHTRFLFSLSFVYL